MADAPADARRRWLGPGVAGIGTASFLADVGHEIPTALLPNLLTASLAAPASWASAAGIGDDESADTGSVRVMRLR